jgi:hypothetical protein
MQRFPGEMLLDCRLLYLRLGNAAAVLPRKKIVLSRVGDTGRPGRWNGLVGRQAILSEYELKRLQLIPASGRSAAEGLWPRQLDSVKARGRITQGQLMARCWRESVRGERERK